MSVVEGETDAAPSTEWTTEIDALRNAVQKERGDCASLVVSLEGTGAGVKLTTEDGRVVRRHIEGPRELTPSVRALLVTIPLPEPRMALDPKESAETESTTLATFETSPALETPRPMEPHEGQHQLFVTAAAGLRVPSHAAGGPVGQVSFGITIARWDLAALGRWEAERDTSEHGSSLRSSASAIGGGLSIGRRETLGSLWVVFGTTASLYSATAEQRLVASQERVHEASPDARVGAYLGLVVPVARRTRARFELGADLALLEHPDGSSLPNAKHWGAGFTVGIESGFLP